MDMFRFQITALVRRRQDRKMLFMVYRKCEPYSVVEIANIPG